MQGLLFSMVALFVGFATNLHAVERDLEFRKAFVDYYQTLEEYPEMVLAQIPSRLSGEIIDSPEAFFTFLNVHFNDLSQRAETNPVWAANFLDKAVLNIFEKFFESAFDDDGQTNLPQFASSGVRQFLIYRDQIAHIILNPSSSEQEFIEFRESALRTHYNECIKIMQENIEKSPTASGPNLDLTTPRGKKIARLFPLDFLGRFINKMIELVRREFAPQLENIGVNPDQTERLKAQMSFYMTQLTIKYYIAIWGVNSFDNEVETQDSATKELVEFYNHQMGEGFERFAALLDSVESNQLTLDENFVLSENLIMEVIEDVNKMPITSEDAHPLDESKRDLDIKKCEFDELERRIATLEEQMQILLNEKN